MSALTQEHVAIALTHDATITIATGAGKRETNWRPRTGRVSAFYTRLANPMRTPETMDELDRMTEAQQRVLKDQSGGYFAGTLAGTNKTLANVLSRTAIALDMDQAADIEVLWDRWSWMFYGCGAFFHTTRSHRVQSPRARLVVPTHRSMTVAEYLFVSQRIAEELDMLFDPSTHDTNRFMYWPSACVDQEFRYEYIDAPFLNVDDYLRAHPNWQQRYQEASRAKVLDVKGYQIQEHQLTEGEGRNNDLATFARKMYQHGFDDEAVFTLVLDHNTERNYTPTLDVDEVTTIYNSAKREHARIVAERISSDFSSMFDSKGREWEWQPF